MKTRAKSSGKSRRASRPANRRGGRAVTSSRASASRGSARGSRQRGGASKTRSQRQTSSRKRSSTRATGGAKLSQRTRDHDQIQQWVEARGGHPAMVKATERGQPKQGVLRIDFPGFSGARSLEHVSWEEWFEVFDNRGLEFLYQEKSANGKQSRFNKLVSAS
jgi:hypothetical protein